MGSVPKSQFTKRSKYFSTFTALKELYIDQIPIKLYDWLVDVNPSLHFINASINLNKILKDCYVIPSHTSYGSYLNNDKEFQTINSYLKNFNLFQDNNVQSITKVYKSQIITQRDVVIHVITLLLLKQEARFTGILNDFYQKFEILPNHYNTNNIDTVNGNIVFSKDLNNRENILSKGYKLVFKPDNIDSLDYKNGQYNLYQFEENPILSYFYSQGWDELLQIIGPWLMSYLLECTILFLCVQNESIVQISGSIKHIERVPSTSIQVIKQSDAIQERILSSIKVKFRPLFKGYIKSYPNQFQFDTPNKVNLNRHTMFYQRYTLNPNNKIRLGFPTDCCLKLLNAVELCSFIFPLEFKTPNGSDSKLPPRLLNINYWLSQIQDRFENFEFNRLIKLTCPLKVPNQSKPLDINQLDQIELSTLVHLQTSHIQVIKLVVKVFDNLFPKCIWGSEHNWNIFNKFIENFIMGTRYEYSTLHGMIQGYKINDCSWICKGFSVYNFDFDYNSYSNPNQSKNPCTSKSEFNIRKRLIAQIMYWIIEAILIPFLKTTFYITEGQHTAKGIIYYRQDVYQQLEKKFLTNNYGVSIYKPIDKTGLKSLFSSNCFNLSKMRFIPKKDGSLRPIAQLGTKMLSIDSNQFSNTFSKQMSINTSLRYPFLCLKHEMTQMPNLTQVAVNGPQDILNRIQEFKNHLTETKHQGERIYFVKMDIEKCFDNIPHDSIISMVENLLNKKSYKFVKTTMVQFSLTNSRLISKYNQFATPIEQVSDFNGLINRTTRKYSKVVIQDHFVKSKRSKDVMIKEIIHHIKSNILKLGPNFLIQTKGIPQGSILSNLLCNMYYGHLECKYLNDYVKDKECLLMRTTDDILFISSNINSAKQFYQQLSEWNNEEFVLKINVGKTTHNLDFDNTCQKDKDLVNFIHWCGLHICIPSLEVSLDLDRIFSNSLRDTITLNKYSHPGKSSLQNLINGVRFSLFRVFIIRGVKTRNSLSSYSMFATNTIYRLKINLFWCLTSQFSRFIATIDNFERPAHINYLLQSINGVVQLVLTLFNSHCSKYYRTRSLKLSNDQKYSESAKRLPMMADIRKKAFIQSIPRIVYASFFTMIEYKPASFSPLLHNRLIYHLGQGMSRRNITKLNCQELNNFECDCQTNFIFNSKLQVENYMKLILKSNDFKLIGKIQKKLNC